MSKIHSLVNSPVLHNADLPKIGEHPKDPSDWGNEPDIQGRKFKEDIWDSEDQPKSAVQMSAWECDEDRVNLNDSTAPRIEKTTVAKETNSDAPCIENAEIQGILKTQTEEDTSSDIVEQSPSRLGFLKQMELYGKLLSSIVLACGVFALLPFSFHVDVCSTPIDLNTTSFCHGLNSFTWKDRFLILLWPCFLASMLFFYLFDIVLFKKETFTAFLTDSQWNQIRNTVQRFFFLKLDPVHNFEHCELLDLFTTPQQTQLVSLIHQMSTDELIQITNQAFEDEIWTEIIAFLKKCFHEPAIPSVSFELCDSFPSKDETFLQPLKETAVSWEFDPHCFPTSDVFLFLKKHSLYLCCAKRETIQCDASLKRLLFKQFALDTKCTTKSIEAYFATLFSLVNSGPIEAYWIFLIAELCLIVHARKDDTSRLLRIPTESLFSFAQQKLFTQVCNVALF